MLGLDSFAWSLDFGYGKGSPQNFKLLDFFDLTAKIEFFSEDSWFVAANEELEDLGVKNEGFFDETPELDEREKSEEELESDLAGNNDIFYYYSDDVPWIRIERKHCFYLSKLISTFQWPFLPFRANQLFHSSWRACLSWRPLQMALIRSLDSLSLLSEFYLGMDKQAMASENSTGWILEDRHPVQRRSLPLLSLPCSRNYNTFSTMAWDRGTEDTTQLRSKRPCNDYFKALHCQVVSSLETESILEWWV